MTPDGRGSAPGRVLVVAPEGRDASVIARVLSDHGMEVHPCADVAELVQRLAGPADAAFITEEALQHDASLLLGWIERQPPWSDFPFVVLVARRYGRRTSEAVDPLVELSHHGNMVLLERPLNAQTLISGARSALRARARQYEAMKQLQAEAQLRLAEHAARTDAANAGRALAVAVDAGELGTFHCPLPLSRIDCSDRCRRHLYLRPEGPLVLADMLRSVHRDDARLARRVFLTESADTDSRELELRTIAPDGEVRWLRVKGRVYRDAGGKPARFDGVTLDVTPQKLMERERESLLQAEREARREAERAGRMKDEFISTLSHELRTPLSAILGWTYILRQGASPEVVKGAEIIERNARAQARLIEDLLDVSRIASGNIRLEPQRVSMVGICEAVLQTLAPGIEAKRLSVRIESDSWRGELEADASRLQQIVWNIVANAIKFTPAGGEVRMRADLEGGQVVLRVQDSGDGIDPEFLPHVFDRFRQGEASEARSYGGLGLGLAIVRQLAEMHGGSVEAHSAGRGLGAAFVVRLPLRSPLATGGRHAPAGDASGPEGGVLEGRKLLVVDDEEDGREMLAILLRAHGAEVTTAGSAEEALVRLRRDLPDVLISDIGMPHTDGYQLMRTVRHSALDGWRTMPAIALTAFARPEDADKARDAGFQTHLAKPFEPVRLVGSIRDLVARTASGKAG